MFVREWNLETHPNEVSTTAGGWSYFFDHFRSSVAGGLVEKVNQTYA